jgi:membrane protein required for colicin V production
MSWPDYAILATIAISMLVGLLRGFIKEVFSLVVWAAAFVVAYRFAGDIAVLMEEQVSVPSARTAIGFIGLFIVVLVVGGLANYLLGRLVESTGLSGTDRLLGGFFGLARGMALVVVAILVTGFTPLPADAWWKDSRMIQSFMPLVVWSAEFLPASATDHLDFDPKPAEESSKDGSGQDSDNESRKEHETEEDERKSATEPGEELEPADTGSLAGRGDLKRRSGRAA